MSRTWVETIGRDAIKCQCKFNDRSQYPWFDLKKINEKIPSATMEKSKEIEIFLENVINQFEKRGERIFFNQNSSRVVPTPTIPKPTASTGCSEDMNRMGFHLIEMARKEKESS